MTMKRITLFAAFLSLILSACTSVETLVERGNYEETIRKAQKKLTGKDRKNPRYVAALETAVNRSLERDLAAARRLESAGNTDWGRIHAIYADIDARQRAIRPLLPLADKNGRRANLEFIDVADKLAATSGNAAEQYYTEAKDLLIDARAGDKEAARKAHRRLGEVQNYRSDYRNAAGLRDEARELGKVFIYVAMVNETNDYLPRRFEEELLRLNTRDMDDEWRFYDLEARDGVTYDYDANMVIRDIQIEPERITERVYTDEASIRDGVEYVLDANGNVAKDSLGNDITRPRNVIVRATVSELQRTKSALVTGSLVLYDNAADRIVEEEEMLAEANFSAFSVSYRGDRRALSRDTRRNLDNRTRRIPTDEELILDATDALKPQLQNALVRSYRTK